VSDDGGALIPMFANYIMALNISVMHDTMAGNFDNDGYNAAEPWWFA
jgi:peptide/nickel transport system substrate-binding protein